MGSFASLNSKYGKHFSLLINYNDTKLWIDPAIELKDDVDGIIITQSSLDHYKYLDSYLKNHITNIYTTSSIKNKISSKFKNKIKTVKKLKIDDMQVFLFPVKQEKGVSGVGLYINKKNGNNIVIIPEFKYLTKSQLDLIKDSILFIGVGNYEKPKSNDHKATFKQLLEYLSKSKPKRLYLLNFREELIKFKDNINKDLKHFNGKMLFDNSVITVKNILRKWKEPYKPVDVPNEQLRDDWRLAIAHYSNLLNHRNTPYSKDYLIDLGVKIAKEIAKRKKTGDINFSISESKSDIYKKFWNEIKKHLTSEEISLLTDLSKSLKPGYYSISKPVYRGYFEELEGNLKSIKWDDKKVLVDTKWDGLRMTIGKVNGDGFAYVDPENLKRKSPNVSSRIPAIIKEIEDTLPDGTILDGEFLALHPNGKEMLHRTDANSILNSNMKGEELEKYAIIVIFDVLYYEGDDIRKLPLHERLEYLSRLKSTKHIWIEKISTTFPAKADGFIVNSNNISKIKKISEYIRFSKNGRPKYCAEGIMIKLLDWQYETPQNHGWMKVKYYSELDLRVIDRKLVKGSKHTFNYYLGYDTPIEYAKSYLSITTKDWYGKVIVMKDNKVVAKGKDCIDYLDKKGYKFVTIMGKSDNTNVDANIGDIIRIAAEEVLKFDNPKDTRYPRYSFYIGRVLEPIPEKNVTDTLSVIDKLSSFEPQRIPISELRRLNSKNLQKGQIVIVNNRLGIIKDILR